MLRKLGATIALGVLALATGASAQSGEAMYFVHFYSDATLTEEVGYLTPECRLHPAYPNGHYVYYRLTGTHTYHSVDEFAGYCPEDRP